MPVPLVNPLDQDFADFAGEVEIDIGNRVQFVVQEATEEQVVLEWIDVGKTDQIADDRADR